MSNEAKAAAQLARADISQLRMTGLILSILIDRKLMTRGEAVALIAEAKPFLGDNPTMHEVYAQLLAEFRQ